MPSAIALDVVALEAELAKKSPQAILEKALSLIDNIYISFSGAEDVVLIDMAHKIKKDIKVFSLDTGRLHPETYQYIDRVRKHYGIIIDVMSPNTEALEKFTQEKGFYSFYDDGHKECCNVRKVEPLRRKLALLDGWITGQRQDQNPSTRGQVPVVQEDKFFSGPGKNLVKFNPL